MIPQKYPRTFHLSFSEGCTSDDKIHLDNSIFLNKDIIITAKLDGSNFCMTNEDCFARSHSGPPTHASFDWAKAFHAQGKHRIPEEFAVFAEYCFAKHSIHYENLPHYLAIFNILDMKREVWLAWNEVEDWADDWAIPTVPVLFRGKCSSLIELEKLCSSLGKEKEFGSDEREGVVIRVANEFSNQDFSNSCGKMVRPNHVQTSEHWSHQEITRNKLS